MDNAFKGNAINNVFMVIKRYRHAADKLQKTENVMEKYKKKLEESADLRRRIKVCK